MNSFLTSFVQAFSIFVFLYYIAYASISILLIVRSGLRLYFDTRHQEFTDLLRAGTSPATPGVSMIVPAYNEQAGIVEAVHALLDVDYPRRELIIVNDGSTDGTMALLQKSFDLVDVPLGGEPPIACSEVRGMYLSRRNPELRVIDKANGGRSDAVNAGIGVAQLELLFITDADGVIEPDALLHGVQPYIDDHERTMAIGGQVRIANGSTFSRGRLVKARVSARPVEAFQTLEYVRGFLGGRTGWATMGALYICSGAFGIFRREAVIASGGLDPGSLGEDFEMSVRLLETHAELVPGARIAQANDAVCWTEAPSRLRDLRTQRRRWHVGLLETMWRHRGMTFRRRYGGVGMVTVPFLWAFEVAGPVLETLGYIVIPLAWWLGILDASYAVALFVVSVLLGVTLSISNLLLEEIAFGRYPRMRDMMILLLYAVAENFGFRQLTSWWRTRTTIELLFGRRPGWGSIQRTGLSTEDEART